MKTVRCVATFLCLAAAVAAAEDPLGDDKLVTPYPGSTLDVNETKDFEQVVVPLGPRGNDGKLSKSRTLEGRWTRLSYSPPAGRSDLEMGRNYEEGLRRAGFQILFTCRKEACGTGSAKQPGLAYWPYDSSNTVVAQKTIDGQEVWVMLDARSNQTLVNVIRPKSMQGGLVTVDAAALKKGIADEGHVAVYGIHFDSGRSELKPSSAPAIAEIVRLLKENPGLRIHVVGHTDGLGGLDANLALSRSRAASVVKELTSPRHGVKADRLLAQGVGPLVPLATNKTEEGRARNRRVDLVER